MRLPGPPLLVLVAALLLAVGLGALWQVRAITEDDRPVPAASDPASSGDPAAVLGAWDAQRSAAYAEGDLDALADLYAPGSTAGRRDVALLRRYVARGLTVTGMRPQVLGLEVRDGDPAGHDLVLLVTDRVTGAVAAGTGPPVRLPLGVARTRVIRLVDDSGRWLVDEVRAGARE